MKLLIKFLVKTLFRTKIIGIENLTCEGASIIMPNHTSFLDAVLLYPFLPSNATFVINTEIAKKLSFIFRFVNHTTIDPLNPYSLKKTIAYVKEGNTVVIFPEGRITSTGNFMKIYNGVAMIAAKTNAKIYPIILSGSEYSKFSRIKDKVNSRMFPKIDILCEPAFKIEQELVENFRKNKNQVSNSILTVMQNAKFKLKQKQGSNNNLFNKFIEVAKLHGYRKIVATDGLTKLTYKKAILSSYVMGKHFNWLLKDEEKVGVLLPTALGHLVTLLALFYSEKTPAILNFTAGITNNIECAQTASLKTILTSRKFVEAGKFGEYINDLSKHFRIIYLEDVKEKISISEKLYGIMCLLGKKKAIENDKQAVILYTSGSESKPKGVVLSHKNLISNVNQMSTLLDFTHRDKALNALPMFHSFGLTAGTLLPILSGIEVFLYPTPLHYKVIPEIVYDRNITTLLGTPSFLMGYAKNAHPYDFNTLRFVIAGGEKLKEDVKKIWNMKFGIRVLEGYGTTETSPVLSVNSPLFYRDGSVGRFLPGIEWKTEPVEGIEDGGNLYVKGPNVMEGYLLYEKGFVKAPEWYNCGDIVSIDKEGFIIIKARLKRFAKISGEMVSLDSVEQLALQCYPNEKFATTSISDDKKGEKILLCTTSENVNKKALREFYADNGHSTLALPAEIIVMEKLPLLGNGKVDYIKLKTLVTQGS